MGKNRDFPTISPLPGAAAERSALSLKVLKFVLLAEKMAACLKRVRICLFLMLMISHYSGRECSGTELVLKLDLMSCDRT